MRDFPREYFTVAGMQVTVEGDTVAAREVLSEARSLMYRLELMTPEGLEQNWLNMQLANGGAIAVNINHGVKTAHIFVPPVPKKAKEEKVEIELPMRILVPAFDLFASSTEFIGHFINAGMSWDTPSYFIARDDEDPHGSWDYRDSDDYHKFDINAIVSEKESIKLTRLSCISTDWPEEGNGEGVVPEPELDQWWWGEDETYDSVEHAIFGVSGGDWVFDSGSGYDVWMRDLNSGGVYKLTMLDSCTYDPIHFMPKDSSTNSYFVALNVRGADSGIEWPPDGVQILTQHPFEGHTIRSIGYLSPGGNCYSETSVEVHIDVADTPIKERVRVEGVEGYADETTILTAYIHETESLHYTETERPWYHIPYNNDEFKGMPSYKTIAYFIKAEGAWGSLTYEYAHSASGHSTESSPLGPQSSIWRLYIYDFHGEPVYLFSWRGGAYTGGSDSPYVYEQYGMIYKGKVIVSEQFPLEGSGTAIDGSIIPRAEEHGGLGFGEMSAVEISQVIVR